VPHGWQVRQLGSFCSKVGSGATPLGGKAIYLDERASYALIRSQHVFDRHFDPDGLAFISDTHARELRNAEVQVGDVLLNITGDGVTFARACLAPTPVLPACVNQHVAIIRVDPAICVPGFLLSFLTHPAVKRYIESHNTGASRRAITKGHIESFRIPLPPLVLQSRIAGILSAYDELIENNTRRIQLLERMAQALYREWFVNFRFPGHAKVKRVASPLGLIPQGWEAAKLADHLIALESGKRPKGGVGDLANGVPSIGAESIKGIGQHDFGSEKYVSREFFEQMRKGVVRDGDVAIYKDGAYIGRSSYLRDGFPHRECCVNEHVFLLRSSGHRLTQNMLYLWLQEPDTVHAIRGTNANAAQPGINQQSVNGLGLVTPPVEVAAEFDRMVEPLLAEIVNCTTRNKVLRRTRDLLLPIGVTPRNILHTSSKRNPHLTKVFYDLKLMEGEGSGFDRMYEVLLTSGRPIPEVQQGDDRVVVTVRKQITRTAIVDFMVKADQSLPLSQKELITLGLLAQHEALTAIDLVKTLELSRAEDLKHWIGRLKDWGVVNTRGKTKATEYFVEPQVLRTLEFQGGTTLKGIERHRLRELILRDLEIYRRASISQIHERIGKEIPRRKVRRELAQLVGAGEIGSHGARRGAVYVWTK
jgi:restriction endonuclease S subunit